MARLNETDLSERLFLKGYPFKRYAPRPDGPVTTAITPLRKPRAEWQSVPSFSKVSAVTASFRDAGLAVAHTAGMGSSAHPLQRFQVTAVVVDILADSLDRHPLAVECMAARGSFDASASA
jgi:hypothetical protein